MQGLFIEAEQSIDVDEPVMVEFSVIVGEVPKGVIASGHVVRCFDAKDTISGRIRSGLGLRFELTLAGKGALKAFIRERVRVATDARQMRVERRGQDRIDASLPVAWRPPRGDWRHGYLLRLHGSAEFVIETPTLVSTDTPLDLRVELPLEGDQSRIDAAARVTGLMASPDQAGGMIVDLDLSPFEIALITRYARLSSGGVNAEDPPAQRQARA
jgi:hypothetical protein